MWATIGAIMDDSTREGGDADVGRSPRTIYTAGRRARRQPPGRGPSRRALWLGSLTALVVLAALLVPFCCLLRSHRGASSAIASPATPATSPGTPSPSPAATRSPSPRGSARPSLTAPPAELATQRRALDRLLSQTSYVRLAGSRRREVALTFDDGPGPATPQILAILLRTRTPATFFVIGRQVSAYPQLVAAEARDGFVVGDHTETHPFLSRLSAGAQAAEIIGAADQIRQAGAPYPRLFRPPYGSFDQATLALLHAQRMLMVLWSADSKDYSRPGVRQIAYTAISGAQPGAIILLHDGGSDREQTVAALPRIIRRLRQRGYRLVSIPQLVSDDPPALPQPPPQQLSGLN
jgi:peptidoglycan/xylan/chitin deacetylase (PgdA/CDA1 family)